METATLKTVTYLNDIQKFLKPKKLAVAGASRNPKKFGGTVLKELKEKGFEVYPVNPHASEIQELKCYRSVTELPADVYHLLIVTPKNETLKIADEAISKGIKMIWIQQMSETPDAVNSVRNAGIPLISKKCILMFADPVTGPHRFHRFLVKLFGRYPKEAYKNPKLQ
jgi:predicted CoA-binding protein